MLSAAIILYQGNNNKNVNTNTMKMLRQTIIKRLRNKLFLHYLICALAKGKHMFVWTIGIVLASWDCIDKTAKSVIGLSLRKA